jgi:hypothetical protein
VRPGTTLAVNSSIGSEGMFKSETNPLLAADSHELSYFERG